MSRGFTFIEILMALLIIAILSLISLPLMNSVVQKYRLATAAEQLYNVLQSARMEAIKRNTNVYVTFSTGDSWCYGVSPSSTCNCQVANNCSLGAYTAPAAQQTTLSATGLSSNAVYFESSHGGVSATAALTFTVYNGSKLITISISKLGNLQMCSTGLSGYTAC